MSSNETAEGLETASRPIVVIIHRSGPQLPETVTEPAHPLGLRGLRALVRLEQGLGLGDDPALLPLRQALDARSLLGEPSSTAQPTGELVQHDPLPPREDQMLVLTTPSAVLVRDGGFVAVDHHGRVLIHLSPAELMATKVFDSPAHPGPAYEAHQALLGDDALDRPAFDDLLDRLESAHMMARAGRHGENTAEAQSVRLFRDSLRRAAERGVETDRWLAEREAERLARERETGRRQTKVVPVTNSGAPILSLGLVMSAAKVYEGGRLERDYEFVADWMDRTIPKLTGDEPPMIFLFSNYVWCHAWNLEAAARVKAANPAHITVHGGPDTPKYAADVDAYFERNPQVDIAVQGEGEATFAELLAALDGRLDPDRPDLSKLAGVAGLSFRDGDRTVQNEPRDRIQDLDLIPSPVDLGLFDSIGHDGFYFMVIETNRGCPYGCTYCDWGSATLSRIRKFDLERVFRELEWAAQRNVERIFCADANFGVFKRDVELARKVVELKREYGCPRYFGTSYAKNTVKHLREIVQTLVEGDILTTGILSSQSSDPETLLAVRRSNIKVERYDDLAGEFSKNDLPLHTELMMGLPGSTVKSFAEDLQRCVEKEMQARVHRTELLVNSPMNEPEYREQYRIETEVDVHDSWVKGDGERKAPYLISTASFSFEDYQRMDRFRHHLYLFENYGVLRQVARFVRQEAGLLEMELYRTMEDAALSDPNRWPTLALTFDRLQGELLPPVSWRFFIDDLRDFLTGPIELAGDSALETVLSVQHALLPARDRTFPFRLTLEHDYATWYRTMLAYKQDGHYDDWVDLVPRLATYGPAEFEVSDPNDNSHAGFGDTLPEVFEMDWEMHSPVSRSITNFREVK